MTNSSDVVDAYSVELYGVDPQWVTAVPSRLALFPGVHGEIELTVGLPPDYPSMLRTLALNVRSENDPGAFALADVRLSIIPRSELSVKIEPNLSVGGRRANFGMLVRNGGNTEAVVPPFGVDPEAPRRSGSTRRSCGSPRARRCRCASPPAAGGRGWAR